MYSPDSTSSPHRKIPPIILTFLILLLSITMVSATPLPRSQDEYPNVNAMPVPSPKHVDPNAKWSIVFDLGSSGSRIHVDAFNGLSHAASYLAEVDKGLSSFSDNPSAAGETLTGIMELAMKVPDSAQHSCPVAIRATGGLRLLSDQGLRKRLLNAVKDKFEAVYKRFNPQLITAGVLEGKDEALFAWLAANYLLGTLNGKTPTVALVEMGGASAQLVFEYTDSNAGEHQIKYTFVTKEYDLMQRSDLGYGRLQAKKAVDLWLWKNRKGDGNQKVAHPCLTRGTSKSISLRDGSQETVEMVGLKKSAHSSDAFNACSSLIKNVLFSESSPSQEGIHKNSFRSVKVPSISASFLSHGAKEIVLISAFYEEIKAIAYLFRDAHPSLDTLAINLGFLKKHAGLVCNGGFEAYRPNRGLVEKLKRDLTQCMDFTYMATLLEWYGIPDKQRLELAEYIGQGETRTNMEWAIGAALHLASGQKLD